ncbi:hypothetical protein ACVWCN_09700, partial [Escherichia coli]
MIIINDGSTDNSVEIA